MSYKINYFEKKVIATFKSDIGESDIKKAFLEVVENSNIKKLKSIIFDYTNITSYTITNDFVNTVKIYTRFSTAWNENINAIAVATNENIKNINLELAKHKDKLIWNYMLFENLDEALKWCNENE